MSYDFKLHAAKSDLENRLKARYEPGPMRQRLYEVFKVASIPCNPTKFEWMYYAGMGDVALNDASQKEINAAKELLKDGVIVPTFEDNFYDIKDIRRIQHFDDVRFGLDTSDNIIIYDLGPRDLPDFPDLIIRPDAKHDAAIARLKGRMNTSLPNHAIVIDETPIQLRDGQIIRPLITDPHLADLRIRQIAFKL